MIVGGSGVVSFWGVLLCYGEMCVVDDVSLEILVNCMVGLIGLDGVGKFSLLVLLVGVWKMQDGEICVFDGDMCDCCYCWVVCLCIVYMFQGLGKNFYLMFLVFENVDFFGWLFGYDKVECEWCIVDLL